MALAHEQAHLRRGDLWLGLLPSLVSGAVFFFPPARWAVREYHLAREEACDAEALRRTGAAPAQYGRLLLRFASPALPGPALGLGAGYQSLRRRLTTLPQAVPRPLSPGGAFGSAGLALGTAAGRSLAVDGGPTRLPQNLGAGDAAAGPGDAALHPHGPRRDQRQ